MCDWRGRERIEGTRQIREREEVREVYRLGLRQMSRIDEARSNAGTKTHPSLFTRSVQRGFVRSTDGTKALQLLYSGTTKDQIKLRPIVKYLPFFL